MEEMVKVSKEIIRYGDVMQNRLANVLFLLSEDFEGKSLEYVLAVVEEARKGTVICIKELPAFYEFAAVIRKKVIP